MRECIFFWVDGVAKPAGSKRGFAIKKGGVYTGRVAIVDANKNSRDWKTDVGIAAHRKAGINPELWTGPLHLTLAFVLRRPKCHYRSGKNAHLLRDDAPPFPVGMPDATKLVRGVEDALTGILWKDDAQIVTQHVTKRYGDTPGVAIVLREEETGNLL